MAMMLGNNSGLKKNDRLELQRWANLFHEEVHGSRLTFYSDLDVLYNKKRLPPTGPEPRDMDVAMFLNRSSEICWMLLRTLPFLQLKPQSFGEEWANKWTVLDESFRQSTKSLSELGKKIASSFITLIDTKFPFSPDSAFEERG